MDQDNTVLFHSLLNPLVALAKVLADILLSVVTNQKLLIRDASVRSLQKVTTCAYIFNIVFLKEA